MNRQVFAFTDTVGRHKAEVTRRDRPADQPGARDRGL